MKNTVTRQTGRISTHPISSFDGGTLIEWKGRIYVVLEYKKNNHDQVGAVCLEDGGYLSPTEGVVGLSAGETVTIVPEK